MASKLYNKTTGVVSVNSGQDAVGNYVSYENGLKHYSLTTAITGNVTVTAAVSGSRATTSNATGLGKNFRSDGSKWQDIAGAGTVVAGAAVVDPAALTSAVLTDNSAGTANTTVQALADGTTYATDVAAIRNNFADLTAQINALRVDIGATRTQLIALITSLEGNGVLTP